MAYSNFIYDDLITKFGLTIKSGPLFREVKPLEPSKWLQESLARAGRSGRFNEKSRSEFLVAPLLASLRDYLGERYAYYSGADLPADAALGLVGECDFLLSRAIDVPYLQTPIMVIVEAKKGDVETGLPQCATQMLGARIFNERAGKPVPRIHGCVTTGDDWRFCRLEGNVLTTDVDLFYLENLGTLLAILVECLKGNDQ